MECCIADLQCTRKKRQLEPKTCQRRRKGDMGEKKWGGGGGGASN